MSDGIDPTDDLNANVRGLATETRVLSAEIINFRFTAKRNRQLIRVLAYVLALIVILFIAVGWVAIRANDASNTAKAAAERATSAVTQARTLCLAINTSNEVQLQVLTGVLDLFAQSAQTDAARTQFAKAQALIDQAFAPRQC